jgi:large subunit ribosomal protein L6
MSRVAKNPIKLPAGVNVNINGQEIQIKGNKGALQRKIHDIVSIKYEDNLISFAPRSEDKAATALAGTTRALVNNMVIGVSQGFEKKLNLVGVGYRAQVQGETLALTLGYSHPINYKIPAGITIETPSPTDIIVKGIDKQLVGEVCADIITYRPVEPYKGKGVRFQGQLVILKEAKKK